MSRWLQELVGCKPGARQGPHITGEGICQGWGAQRHRAASSSPSTGDFSSSGAIRHGHIQHQNQLLVSIPTP